MALSEIDGRAAPVPPRLFERVAARWRAGGEQSAAPRSAAIAFAIRLVGAALVFGGQVVMARLMGRYQFGIYVSAWAWVSVFGSLAPLGFGYAAQRFVPEYRGRADEPGLRGFLTGSRLFGLGFGFLAGIAMAGAVHFSAAHTADHAEVPLMIAAAIFPLFALSVVQDGIARSFGWLDLALVPLFVLQPALILLLTLALAWMRGPMSAVALLGGAFATLWVVVLVQGIGLQRRLVRTVPRGPRRYDVREWFRISLPILLVDGFFLLLASIDILVLQALEPPQEVAIYFAAVKVLAVVQFVAFAIGAAVAHRFSTLAVSGERDALARLAGDAAGWSFWPTLLAAAGLAVVGKAILTLFGDGFAAGYPLMLIVLAGLVVRSSVGPADRLLSMTGHQRLCAGVYAIALAVCLASCLVLIPRFGLMGAAVSTAGASVLETLLLLVAVRRRLGFSALVGFGSLGAVVASLRGARRAD